MSSKIELTKYNPYNDIAEETIKILPNIQTHLDAYFTLKNEYYEQRIGVETEDGMELFGEFEYLEASKLYKELLNKLPNNIYLLSNYCNKLISLSKFSESIKLLNKLD